MLSGHEAYVGKDVRYRINKKALEVFNDDDRWVPSILTLYGVAVAEWFIEEDDN